MGTNQQQISPMLWFDRQAEEAVELYTSTFPNSRRERVTRYGKAGFEFHGQPEGAVMTIDFTLDGRKFTALNAGPMFTINPSISFFATYESETEVDRIWKSLSAGGSVLMPLDKYPWSQKYGWLQDRFGVAWQLAWGNRADVGGESIVTSLMFVGKHCGQAEAAMQHYTSIFSNSEISGILRYGPDRAPDKEGTVMHAQFTLGGQTFAAMDSGMDHNFTFNEGISLVVACDTQEQVDYFWERLSEDGDPKAQVCGWLKDKFGVSWQVVPKILEEMLLDHDRKKVENVTKAYMQMKKFDIAALRAAFEDVKS